MSCVQGDGCPYDMHHCFQHRGWHADPRGCPCPSEQTWSGVGHDADHVESSLLLLYVLFPLWSTKLRLAAGVVVIYGVRGQYRARIRSLKTAMGANEPISLLCRHNGCGGVSNNPPHDCLLNRLFRRRSKNIQQGSTSLAFVRGIRRGSANYPHKWPVTVKMFPLDDVIMSSVHIFPESSPT